MLITNLSLTNWKKCIATLPQSRRQQHKHFSRLFKMYCFKLLEVASGGMFCINLAFNDSKWTGVRTWITRLFKEWWLYNQSFPETCRPRMASYWAFFFKRHPPGPTAPPPCIPELGSGQPFHPDGPHNKAPSVWGLSRGPGYVVMHYSTDAQPLFSIQSCARDPFQSNS